MNYISLNISYESIRKITYFLVIHYNWCDEESELSWIFLVNDAQWIRIEGKWWL